MRFNPIYRKLAMGSLLLFGWINWHLLGPLFKRYGDRACSGIGRSIVAKVSSMIQNNGWRLPRMRNCIIQEISHKTPGSFLPDVSKEDSVEWISSQ